MLLNLTIAELYPSEMTEEYTKLFKFINTEYQAVSENYELITNKYIERFTVLIVLVETQI